MRASVVEGVGALVTTSTDLGSSAAPGIQAVTVFSFQVSRGRGWICEAGSGARHSTGCRFILISQPRPCQVPASLVAAIIVCGFHELITIHASSQQGYPEKRTAGQRRLMQAECGRLQQTRHVHAGQLFREVCRIIALEAVLKCALWHLVRKCNTSRLSNLVTNRKF